MQAPPRLLPLQGATNFRDLGGYTGHSGRPLRWRRVFRSDHLGGLTAEDHRTLATLGVRRAFDFRGLQESAAHPYRIPGVQQLPLAIEPTVAQEMHRLVRAGVPLTPEAMRLLMEDLYRRLVNHEHVRFAQWFGHLLEDATPLVFHCTAGKDRTGLAAALLLHALGVPADVIEHDYLLTNVHYRRPPPGPEEASARVPAEALEVLWSVQPSFLQVALQTIEADHGGMDRFLAERMGLTPARREQLAALYLEPA